VIQARKAAHPWGRWMVQEDQSASSEVRPAWLILARHPLDDIGCQASRNEARCAALFLVWLPLFPCHTWQESCHAMESAQARVECSRRTIRGSSRGRCSKRFCRNKRAEADWGMCSKRLLCRLGLKHPTGTTLSYPLRRQAGHK